MTGVTHVRAGGAYARVASLVEMSAQVAHSDRTASAWRTLTLTLAALLLLVLAHDVDHVLSEDRLGELTAAFWVFLPFQYGVFLAVLVLVARRNERAPTLAAALAVIAVLAFVGAHLVPFGPLPYSEGDPLAISWALVFVPMAVALVVLAAALRLRAPTAVRAG